MRDVRRRFVEADVPVMGSGRKGNRRLSSLVGLASQPGCTSRRQSRPEACCCRGNRDHGLEASALSLAIANRYPHE